MSRLAIAACVIVLGACAADEPASDRRPAALATAAVDYAAKNKRMTDRIREAIRLLDGSQNDKARRLLATIVGSVPPPPQKDLGAGTALGVGNSVTIRQLADRCTGADGFKQGFCDGYLMALLEFRAAYDNAYRTRQSYCLPTSATTRDVRKVFLEHTGGQPGWRDHPALWGVSRTLNDRYPC